MKSCLVVLLLLSCPAVSLIAVDQSDARRAAQIQQSKLFFQQALQKNADDINALFNLATLCTETDDLDSALLLLERAERLNERDTQVLTGLGRTRIYKMDAENLQRTFRFLEQAAQQDSTALEARFLLAASFISLVPGHGRFKEAARLLDEVEALDDGYYDTAFYRAALDCVQDNRAAAIAQFRALLLQNPEHRAAQVWLGEVLFHDGDREEASRLYLEGLDHLSDRLEISRVFYQTRDLLTDRDIETFRTQPHRQQGSWIARFWRYQDPTPGTQENEYLTEFFRRREYAITNYRTNHTLTGYDARGRIYVKYGKPDDWYRSGMTLEFAANESWTYYSINPGLRFDFVERGGGFQEEQDLRAALKLQRTGTRIVAAQHDPYAEALQKLYQERVELGGIYAKLGMQPFENIGMDTNLDYVMNDASAEQTRAINESPPNRFVFDFDAKPLNFLYKLATFRGTAGRTRVEIYFGIPLHTLEYDRTADGLYTTLVDLQITFQNQDFQPLKILNSPITLHTEKPGAGNEYYVNQVMYHCAPDRYNFAISVKSDRSNCWGIYKDPLPVPDYSGTHLMLSSIQLTTRVTEPKTLDKTKIKGGIEVQPTPYPGFKPSTPPSIYFEVYNLQLSAEGRARYRTEVAVHQVTSERTVRRTSGSLRPVRSQNPTILLSDEAEITTREDMRVLGLDISGLPAGPVLLTISITDLLSGAQAESSEFFRIEQEN